MNYKISFLLFCCFVNMFVFGQNKNVFNGLVFDEESNKPLNKVTITNNSSKEKVISDSLGKFNISGNKADSLTVSTINNTENIKIEDYLNKNSDSIIIPFNSFLNLDGIIIWGQRTQERKLLKNKPKAPRNPSILKSIATLDIIGVIGKINGTYRRQNALYSYQNKQYYVDRIIDTLGEEYFTDELKIEENKIVDFLFYVVRNYEIEVNSLLKGNYVFDLMNLLEKSKKKYKPE